jgi:hypothetical protein
MKLAMNNFTQLCQLIKNVAKTTTDVLHHRFHYSLVTVKFVPSLVS